VLVYMVTGCVLAYWLVCGTLFARRQQLITLLLFLAGICFFRTALGRSDLGHWVDASSFAWMICLLPLDAVLSLIRRRLRGEREHGMSTAQLCAAGMFLAASMWLVFQVQEPVESFNAHKKRLSRPYRSIYYEEEQFAGAGNAIIPGNQAAQIRQVVEFIQKNTAEEEAIFDFSNQGAYYFLANRRNPTRYTQIAYAAAPVQQREVVEQLEKKSVALVIFKTGGGFDSIDGISNEARHPIISEYLENNFKEAVSINGTEILMRND